MPQQHHMTSKAKEAIKQQVQSKGKSSVWEIYEQLEVAYVQERNPYIRSTLFQLMDWIEDTYKTTNASKQTVSTLKSGKKVFLKDGKPFEVTALPVAPQPKPAQETPTTIDLDDDEQEEVDLPTKDEHLSADDDRDDTNETLVKQGKDEYYMLKRGRINVSKLQRERLEWVNETRARDDLQRDPLSLEPVLHKTAAQWAQTMRNRGDASHERTSGDGYYNYPKLEEWFHERGVSFELRHRTTFIENIGYAWFDCDESDCTDVAIASMRRVFEFFINEEGQAYDAHWKTTIHPEITQVGVGISVDEENNWIYMAAHYATKVIQEPVRITQ